MKHYIFLLIFLVGTSTAQAQTINYFNKTFKPDTMNILSPAILALENGGYIVAHTYNTLNNYEGFAIRQIGSTGETEWFKHLDYGQEEHIMIGGGVLSATPDGLFMLVGSKGEVPLVSGGNRDILMIKFDIEGNILWSTTNGDPDKIENAYHITPTQDGGYIMCGIQRGFTTSNRFYVLKTDAFGNKEWDRVYNPTQHGGAFSIFETNAGYIVSGAMYNALTNYDMYLIEIDKQGEVLWEKNIGGNEADNAGFILPANEPETYFLASATRQNNTPKPFVALLDSTGNPSWTRLYDTEVIAIQEAPLQPMPNGGFLCIYGRHTQFGRDVWLWRFTSTGDTLWTRTIPGLNPQEDWYLKDIAPTADGGYIFSGFNYSTQSSWVVKTDSLGYTCSYLGCDSIATISSVPPQTPPRFEGGQGGEQVLVYPNPAQNLLHFTLQNTLTPPAGWSVSLFTPAGHRVLHHVESPASATASIQVGHLPVGMYIYTVEWGGVVLARGKVAVVR